MRASSRQCRDVERRLRRRSDKLQARVEELMGEIYELTRKVGRVERQERRRISKILHDEIQQRMYGIGLHVSLARQDARAGKLEIVTKDLATVEKWISESTEILRNLTVDLSASATEEDNLADVLGQLAGQMQELHGLNVELHADHRIETIQEVRVLLYQAVRELLFNVVKHANVRSATVDLRHAEKNVEIRVADHGAGFEPDVVDSRRETEPGLGLVGLRERLEASGGSITIDSAPGMGTRITVRIPLAAR